MSIQTALVVDDSRSARYILQRLLEQRRIQVAVAASAQQAFDYLRSHRPDVVFMDDMMPGMDGVAAVERIGADPRTADIPIIMYTANDYAAEPGGRAPQAAATSKRRGIIGVLGKPFTQSDVNNLLAKLDSVPRERPQPPQLRRLPPDYAAPAATPVPVGAPQSVPAQIAAIAPQAKRANGAPHVQSLDSLRAQLAEGLKTEARMIVEQLLGEGMEAQVDARIERHTTAWHQALLHVRLEQSRANSQLLDERLPRLLELLEERLEARLDQQAADLQQRLADAKDAADRLTPLQRAQITTIVRTEAAGLIERSARQSARHVAAELMRGDLSALNLRLERLRRRFGKVIVAAFVSAIAAAVIGYLVGRLG